jgi:hypothetical protein
MSRLRQLALNWLAQADEDRQDAGRSCYAEAVCQSLRDWAATRTNCAVELMRVLQEQEKDPPAGDGHD